MMSEEIIGRDVRDFSYDNMMEYNQNVIINRALPSVYDGLKPVQRKILYSTFKDGHLSSKKFVKSAKIIGSVLGNFHPHGDSSSYDAMVNLIRYYTNNQPLMEGHGAFSSILGDPAAAMRYTEARLNKFSENYLLEDVKNNVVDMKPTFDSEDMEPVTLPAKLPLIFINGVTGIGAGGFASSFPPHHTEAVINSTIALLKDDKVTVKDLIHKYNLKPAFPYGGYVDISNIEKIYSTGTGTFTTRATIERDTESDKKHDLLVIRDLPYLTTLESITNQIKSVHNDPKLKDHEKFLGLQDMQDQSHNVDIKLVLKYKKGTNLDLAIKSLYSKTSLESFVSFNPNMIKDEDTLVEYTNVKDIFLDWIEFRKKTVKRSKMNKIRELERRIHILEAIIKIFRNKKNTDRFLEIVRTSPNRKETYNTLKKEFDLNNVQSEYLTNLRVYNINQFESSKYEDELAEKKIATEEEISYLKDDKKLIKFIIKELEEIRDSKYVKKPEYETKYYTQDPLSDLDNFQVPDTPYTMVFTNEGLLKKVESDVDKVQGRNGKGVSLGRFRDSDAVLTVFNASNRDNILLATADGYLYTYKVHEFPSSNRITNLGNDITSFTKGQQIINAFPLTDGELNGDKLLIVSTNDGYIKAIDLNEFTNSSRNGLLMLKLKDENSFVKSLDIIDKDQYEKATIIITKNDGTYAQYRLTDIPVLNRNTRGSSTYNDRENFELVGSHILLDDTDKYLLVVGEDGKGKLVDTDELSVTNRPSSGQIIIGGRNLAYSTILTDKETSDKDSKLMIVSNKKTVTIPMLDISIYKRPAMGTMLKSLDADEKIVTCSPIV